MGGDGMKTFPTVKKEFGQLSKLDRLKDSTTALLTGAIMTVGLTLGVMGGPTDSKAQPSTSISTQQQGGVILLTQASAAVSIEASTSPFHSSHRSHYSHRSHFSHFSSRS